MRNKRKNEQRKKITNAQIMSCLQKKNLINQNYYNRNKDRNLLFLTIETYLEILSKLGLCFYDEFKRCVYLEQECNLNNHYAELLKQAMSEIDCFEIDAGEKIDQYISQRLKE